MKIHVAYDDRLLAWKGSPASPMRAKRAIDLLEALGADLDVQPITAGPVSNLHLVHDAHYVRDMLTGENAEQGAVAKTMFDGTVQLVRQLLADNTRQPWVGFSPQGAKHHAMWNHSSGFCTFNDFAWAARTLTAAGERVAYVDFDAHHGDGVEALCYHDTHIFTASIHERGIFPGTGLQDAPRQHVWNWALDAESGDVDLVASIAEAVDLLTHFRPTVLLIAAGADGHVTDPLSSLRYTLYGYERVARALARAAIELRVTRVLVGGAGGYQPDDETPAIWATFVDTLANELHDLHATSVHDDEVAI